MPIRMQISLNYIIAQTSWCMKMYCISPYKQQIYLIISIRYGHAGACPKLGQIVILISKMSWAMKLFFCSCVSRDPEKLYICSVISGWCDQICMKYWKHRVSYLSRMNLGMSLVFDMWWGILEYIYKIQSIHMSVVKHTWACGK